VTVVTVSPKYQVVIPKDVREKLNIRGLASSSRS
jgi:AbrB family looped-hinge helix DNA binding protein